MKKHNFYAGPAVLNKNVIQQTKDAVENFSGMGLSLLEISHRSKEFVAVMDKAVNLVGELLDLPKNYKVIFVGGGASSQFFHVPFNLLNTKAAYLKTGVWAKKAQAEAKHFGEVVEIASSEDKTYSYIPKEYTIPTDADYLHITTNNTIYGTEIKKELDSPIPMVADMSSDIFSRPMDVTKYSVIYAGAQKNLGPSGVTLAIVNEDVLGKVERHIPTMVDFRTHIDKESMFNTPPVLPVYTAMKSLEWYKELGGLAAIQKMNELKAGILYDEIDRNRLFKATVESQEDRSLMNICFIMNDEYKELEKEFFTFATERGMMGIKGHRSVGGFRASTYNALEKSSVEALVAAMKEFEAKN
jgi:phosphoserine aminotransferase